MYTIGITNKMLSLFFYKTLFYCHLAIAIFYTSGGLLIFSSAITKSPLYQVMTLNEPIFWLWILYVIIVSLLPFTYMLFKIKK